MPDFTTPFCQTEERGKGRCVLYKHPEEFAHEFMPFGSTTVRAIEKQERLDKRTSDDYEPPSRQVTADQVENAIDNAIAQGKPIHASNAVEPDPVVAGEATPEDLKHDQAEPLIGQTADINELVLDVDGNDTGLSAPDLEAGNIVSKDKEQQINEADGIKTVTDPETNTTVVEHQDNEPAGDDKQE